MVKTIGDAFMAEFTVPSGAVEAAIAAQRGIRDHFADSNVPIRLRIGTNVGEPIEDDGDLYGASVVIAKGLESESENGGILVSGGCAPGRRRQGVRVRGPRRRIAEGLR